MNLAIWLLALSAFAINTTEFGIIGILPPIARDLNIGVDQAGFLVTLFALTVAVAGPPLTVFTARFDRKRLFIAILATFTVANLLAAFAPNFGWLAIARILPALGLPIFWAVASVVAIQLVPQPQQSRAVAVVFAGLSVATVLGVPFGTLIAEVWNWRSAFLVIAALNAVSLLGLALFLPNVTAKNTDHQLQQLGILRRKRLWIGLLSNSLLLAGMFTSYTYLAEFLGQVTQLEGRLISFMLLLFGTAGIIGNWLAGQGLDRNIIRTTRIMIISLAGITAIASLVGASFTLTVPLLLLWGLVHTGCFVVTQVRAISLAPEAPELAGSLNVSICNLGIALGSTIGGWVIQAATVQAIGLAGALVLLLSLALTWGKQKSAPESLAIEH
jgi:predicted MFS family arabinose efflux permease